VTQRPWAAAAAPEVGWMSVGREYSFSFLHGAGRELGPNVNGPLGLHHERQS